LRRGAGAVRVLRSHPAVSALSASISRRSDRIFARMSFDAAHRLHHRHRRRARCARRP
jgi:hypothetical protein